MDNSGARRLGTVDQDDEMEDEIVVNTSGIVADDEAAMDSSFNDSNLFLSSAQSKQRGGGSSSSLTGDPATPEIAGSGDSLLSSARSVEAPIEESSPVVARKVSAAKKPATKKRNLKSADINDDGTPRKRPTKKAKAPLPAGRKRRPPKDGIIAAMDIGRCYDECNDNDKMLIDMKDSLMPKYTWPQIREAWKKRTGEDTAASTLPNRYTRLKDNFSIIKEEDRPHLLVAKDEVETSMAKEKWLLIAEIVKKKGGDSYSPEQLQRQWKKIMVKEGLRPPPGIVDPDYDIRISEDED